MRSRIRLNREKHIGDLPFGASGWERRDPVSASNSSGHAIAGFSTLLLHLPLRRTWLVVAPVTTGESFGSGSGNLTPLNSKQPESTWLSIRASVDTSADLRPAVAGGLRFFLRFALSNPGQTGNRQPVTAHGLRHTHAGTRSRGTIAVLSYYGM